MSNDLEHSNRHWYLVSYDIRDEKRWRQIYKLLRGYGNRIQYSLFRCHVTRTDLEALRWQIEKILANEDDLLIIHLCPTCASHVVIRGEAEGWNTPIKRFEIL